MLLAKPPALSIGPVFEYRGMRLACRASALPGTVYFRMLAKALSWEVRLGAECRSADKAAGRGRRLQVAPAAGDAAAAL